MEDVVMQRLALVVGGTGGIGTAITKALRISDWQVAAVGRNEAWPDRPALVVNAAGAGMLSTSRGDVAGLTEPNVLVAERAGQLAVSAGCRLVHLGTPLSRAPSIDEGDPYVVTKTRASERLRRMTDLDLIELRPHLVVGTPDCLVTRIGRSLRDQRLFELKTPNAERDVVHVSDVARAVVLAATVSAMPVRPIEVGTGKLIAMRDLVALVARLVGSNLARAEHPEAPDATTEVTRLAAPPEPAQKAFGFTARFSIAQAVQRCIADNDRLGLT